MPSDARSGISTPSLYSPVIESVASAAPDVVTVRSRELVSLEASEVSFNTAPKPASGFAADSVVSSEAVSDEVGNVRLKVPL